MIILNWNRGLQKPIGGGIGRIFGIITSFIVRPESNPIYLFIGTSFILGVIILNMISYRQMAKTNKKGPNRQMAKTNKKGPRKGIIVSVLAGVCLAYFYSFVARWKEFKSAPNGTNLMLTLMFICYLIGLIRVKSARF